MILSKQEILLQTKKKIFLNIYGEHTSTFSGNGLDFKELKPYTTNDDIRHINWKRLAKQKQPNVNIFNETKQLNIVLVYLNSGSLYFGNKKSKKDMAVEILTSLSFATVQNDDLLTTIFYDQDNIKFFNPTKNKNIVDINYNYAKNLNPLGKTVDYSKLSTYLLEKLKRKSIIFIIGDFLQECDFSLLSCKHELYIPVLRDNEEEDLKLIGEYNLIDTDSLNLYNITINKSNINKYNQAIKEHDQKLFTQFRKHHIYYKKIYTHEDGIKKLSLLIKDTK